MSVALHKRMRRALSRRRVHDCRAGDRKRCCSRGDGRAGRRANGSDNSRLIDCSGGGAGSRVVRTSRGTLSV